MDKDEALQVSGGYGPLDDPLAPLGRQMRILCPVVEALVLAMPEGQAHPGPGRAIRTGLVGDVELLPAHASVCLAASSQTAQPGSTYFPVEAVGRRVVVRPAMSAIVSAQNGGQPLVLHGQWHVHEPPDFLA